MTSIKGIKRTKASHKSILGSPGSRLKRLKAKRRGNEDPPGNSLEFEQADDCNQRSNRSTGSLANLLEKAGNSASLEVDHGAVPTYFTQRASTSCKSVAELGISLANESELRASVATLPERLSEEKSILVEKYLNGVRKMASQWRAGFSLLFYGYGSKFNLLRLILKECCAGFPAVLIDGLSQRVSYRSILMNILAVSRDCKPSNFSSMSDEDLLQEIREETTHQRIFVMVSNIDGPALRNYRDQRSLSELASIPRLHFGASIDHVNAPLIWDLQTKDRFSWSWNHVPTFVPYIREVNHSSLPSLFLGRKEACTQESAAVVLSSLSNNAREVFRCIADAQLDSEGVGGITFQSLFNVCKEKFLASNETILKTFLTEFKDHDILQTKKSNEGNNDLLVVPLDDTSLRALLSLC